MRKTLWTMVLLLVAVPLLAGGAKNAVKPVATIGTVAVSEEELEKAVGAKLARLMSDVYNIRRGVLEELISTKLIDAEAARRRITADELLKAEVEAKIAEPDLAEVDRIFEGVADRFPGMSKEQAIAEIIKSMRERRIQTRKAEYIRELRDAAGVQVNIQPPRFEVKAEGPSRGSASALVTIVEFSDFECQFCGRAVETLKKIEDKYGDDVRIVFRDYPLAMHRGAKRAAEAGHCAHEQGKFWELHDKLFSKGGPISDPDIFRFATQIGVDHERFSTCMTSGKFKDAWKASADEGVRVGVQSTPTFFVNGRLLVGAAGYEQFARVIDEELAHAKAQQAQKAGTKVAAR
ncbi:MAG TPA: thioredoxin domain-containing protein [Thermoanaerobaculia bacterium]|nr:thioredoxin domain-containing protein [Thermoanaerobaculia bacterium]